MKCPKCKQNIPDESLKCPHCNSRVSLVCPSCGKVNSIFNLKCEECGAEILKRCPKCNAVNFPNAKVCRKCGEVFADENTKNEQIQEKEENLNTAKSEKQNPSQNKNVENIDVSKYKYNGAKVSQDEAAALLVKGILSEEVKVFSISGEKGIGKSTVFKTVMQELSDNRIACLYGKCSPFSQLTGGGLIQDFLLNVFNLPNFCIYNLQYQHDATEFFKKEFPEMSEDEIADLINFLYPHIDGTFEDLLNNKRKMFSFLEKIFDKIILNVNCVIVIDNFELIDAFSYEFLTDYIKKQNVWNRLKLITIYNEPKPVKGYFYMPSSIQSENAYMDIVLAPFEYDKMLEILQIKKEQNEEFPSFSEEELHQIYKLSSANPAFFEQIFALKYDCQKSGQPFELSTHISGIVNQRMSLLSFLNADAYKALICAATLGDKINLSIIQEVMDMPYEKFKDVINYLVENDYISPMSDIYYEFKSVTLWECILAKAKLDENFIKINEQIFEFLSKFILNSISILGLIAQNLKQPQLALSIWTSNTRLTSYTGDTSLYAISQKQCLALINELDDEDTLKIRYNIAERLGKLLTLTNPKDAMEFLPDAINNAKNSENVQKEIELLSYLTTCCRKTGNYYGEVECVDTVLDKFTEESTLKKALLKCSKLRALLAIGNSGQIINMIDNEILPVFDEFFKTKPDNKDAQTELVFESWVKTYLILAQALTLQGNNRSFEVLTILFEIIDNNKIEDELFICNCKLTLALANTMKGNFEVSQKLLAETLSLSKANKMDNSTIILWNFIDIINRFAMKKYDNIQQDLFQIVTFANNNGDNFTKNILKVLLGKYFKDSNEPKHAMEIYNDLIVYFAKEKMALGALITWFMIADVSLVIEGPDSAIDIASQALEVAQNPKIDNYYFVILLKIVLAKAHIIKSDFDSAKMHIETAIKIAKNFEMKDLLSRLYLMYGKYFQEIGLVKSEKQPQYMNAALKMYKAAATLVKQTKNPYVMQNIEKANLVLQSFCRTNNIPLLENK